MWYILVAPLLSVFQPLYIKKLTDLIINPDDPPLLKTKRNREGGIQQNNVSVSNRSGEIQRYSSSGSSRRKLFVTVVHLTS